MELFSREKAEGEVKRIEGGRYLNKIRDVEKALGITLTPQQVYYVAVGEWRRSGKTTAHIIRLLMQEGEPLDLRSSDEINKILDEHGFGPYYKSFFKGEIKKIHKGLIEKGVQVREVLF